MCRIQETHLVSQSVAFGQSQLWYMVLAKQQSLNASRSGFEFSGVSGELSSPSSPVDIYKYPYRSSGARGALSRSIRADPLSDFVGNLRRTGKLIPRRLGLHAEGSVVPGRDED